MLQHGRQTRRRVRTADLEPPRELWHRETALCRSCKCSALGDIHYASRGGGEGGACALAVRITLRNPI